jgi:hypothetical protein
VKASLSLREAHELVPWFWNLATIMSAETPSSSLPSELVEEIFLYLDPLQVVQCRQVRRVAGTIWHLTD